MESPQQSETRVQVAKEAHEVTSALCPAVSVALGYSGATVLVFLCGRIRRLDHTGGEL